MEYDIIIIGAGIGGLTVAAIMSAEAGKRVLVVEKEKTIGGRARSIKGSDIIDASSFKRILESHSVSFIKSFPDLSSLIKDGLLNDYYFDLGIHALTAGNDSRIFHILNKLERPVKVAENIGGGSYWGGRFFDLAKGKYTWMSDEERVELRFITKKMLSLSLDETEKLDDIPLRTWLKKQTQSEIVREFHETMGTLNCSINDPEKISTGDYIKVTQGIMRGGGSMIKSGFGIVSEEDTPGCQAIADKLCEIIRECGGEILTCCKVKELVVEGNKVRKIKYYQDRDLIELEVPIVVSNLPIKKVYSIIPETSFNEDFNRKVKGFWSAGIVCGIFGMHKSLTDMKGFTLIPSLIQKNGHFNCNVRGLILQTSNISPTRAPKGKHLLEFGAFLEESELNEPGKVETVVNTSLDFLKKHYRDFEDAVDWEIFIASKDLSSVAESIGQVGSNRPDVKSSIEGLYFVGDSVKCWGAVIDSVAHSALHCVSVITGKDYLHWLPEYQR